MRIFILSLLVTCTLSLVPCRSATAGDGKLRIGVSFSAERSRQPLDGRILLMISKDGSKEPRFQINDGPEGQLIFGIDVDGLAPEPDAVFDGSVLGFPIKSLHNIPAGEYFVQGLLHR